MRRLFIGTSRLMKFLPCPQNCLCSKLINVLNLGLETLNLFYLLISFNIYIENISKRQNIHSAKHLYA